MLCSVPQQHNKVVWTLCFSMLSMSKGMRMEAKKNFMSHHYYIRFVCYVFKDMYSNAKVRKTK